MKGHNPTRLIYREDFKLNINRAEAMQCNGIKALNGRLQSLHAFKPLSVIRNFTHFANTTAQGLFLCTPVTMCLYNGGGDPVMVHRAAKQIKDLSSAVYRDALYVCYDAAGFWKITADNAQVMDRGSFTDVTSANERVVLLEKNGVRLWISSAGGDNLYIDEDNMIFADLPTPCQAVKAAGRNVIYALGDVCYKIVLSYDFGKVSITPVAYNLGTVYRDTALILNDSLIFASSSGFYRIKNGRAEKIFQNIGTKALDFANCKARIAEGYYILVAPCGSVRKAYAFDVDKQTCIAVLDGNNADVYYWRGKLYGIGGDMYFNGVDDEYANAVFVRSGLDFGCGCIKHLRRVTLTSKSDIVLSVYNGKHTVTKFIRGNVNPQVIPLMCCGRIFDIKIESANCAMDVSDFSIEAEIYKEER